MYSCCSLIETKIKKNFFLTLLQFKLPCWKYVNTILFKCFSISLAFCVPPLRLFLFYFTLFVQKKIDKDFLEIGDFLGNSMFDYINMKQGVFFTLAWHWVSCLHGLSQMFMHMRFFSGLRRSYLEPCPNFIDLKIEYRYSFPTPQTPPHPSPAWEGV